MVNLQLLARVRDVKKRLTNRLRPAGGVALSLLLLVADFAYRWSKSLLRWFVALLPSGARLFGLGSLVAGLLCGGFYVAAKAATLVPWTDWNRVAFVWGLALLVWAVAAVGFIVTKVSAQLLAGIVYRLTDIASRPVHVVDESPRLRPPGAQPSFRDPGRLKNEAKPGTGEFVAYDEETAYIHTMASDLKEAGMDESQIMEMLDEYQKTRSQSQPGS